MRLPELQSWATGSKAAFATSAISQSQRAGSRNQSSGIEPWACDHAASGCVNSAGLTSCGATTTRSPILVMPQSFSAKPGGRRMQPCDAG